MRWFARRPQQEVQGFMAKLLNNHCAEIEAMIEGPRLEGRVRLTIVVLVIPVFDKKPVLTQMFPAVTKEFSTTGVALVVNHARAMDDVILGFRWEHTMKFVHGKARHLNPMGAGFYQLGVQLDEIVHVGDHPELAPVTF